jgi:hypothetical protein
MKVAKWNAIIMGGDGPYVSCGNKALNHQIFYYNYLQFVETASALSTVFN